MAISVDQIIARIREEIRKSEGDGDARRRTRRSRRGLRALRSLRESEDLARLNQEWVLDPRSPIRSHRRWGGGLIVSVKTRLQDAVANVLEGYFLREREFFATLLRLLNRVVEHQETLAEAAHLDDELVVERTEAFLHGGREQLAALEARVDRLARSVAELRAELGTRPPPASPPSAASDGQRIRPAPASADGAARFGLYAAALAGIEPVLHVPAGTGELLQGLAASGVAAFGVEPDPRAAAAARERGVELRGHDLSLGDLAEASVGAVVVTDTERLVAADFEQLLRSALSRLRPGGVALIEAPNPGSVEGLRLLVAAPGASVLDRGGLEALVERCGFVDVESDLVAIEPPPLELPAVELSGTLAGYAENFRRLNDLLFAPARQFVIGRKPEA